MLEATQQKGENLIIEVPCENIDRTFVDLVCYSTGDAQIAILGVSAGDAARLIMALHALLDAKQEKPATDETRVVPV